MAFLGSADVIIMLGCHWWGTEKGVSLALLVISRESPETVLSTLRQSRLRSLLFLSALGNLFSSVDKEGKRGVGERRAQHGRKTAML